MNPLHRSSYRPANRTTKYLPLSRTPSHRRPKPSVNSTHSAERSGGKQLLFFPSTPSQSDESVTINIELSYPSQSSGTSSLQKNRKPSGIETFSFFFVTYFPYYNGNITAQVLKNDC
ncbi:hypothetical protein CAEBREN_01170 [Caenorhabditis brenneri]|uniref:Uncharacterized protein n=1 Tax=Caenorhabditis brenneri TaxID=135651 RepID=G0M715_CAEBE|nr:hypothetical protein CAEBREN_01170 [Caenorhabditis brenneri]